MKLVRTSIIAGLAFFLSAGMSYGAELDDLDLTIRVVESDDLAGVHNELSLPFPAADTAREHAESQDSRGLTQANKARSEENKVENNYDAGAELREEREDEVGDHDEAREDADDVKDERDEAKEEENHEDEHEKESGDTNSSGT